jgi:xanthine dehydrogenase YagS FAD-binding subunit
MNNFNYQRAATTDEAVEHIGKGEDTFFLAGGTNLIDRWKYNLVHPDTLVDINSLAELQTIEETADGGLRLGAMVSNADTAHHPLVKERYPLLSHTILAGASAQIRNSATNGGNLLQRTRCYYYYDFNSPCNKRVPGSGCPAIEGHNRLHAVVGHSETCIATFPSDMCIALSALEAVVQVKGSSGERSIPFKDFHRLPGDTPELDNNLQPDELITAIDLPAEGYADHYSYLKLRDRNSYAFALVSVATGFKLAGNTIQKARISLGGVAHQPWRVLEAEDFLIGKTTTDENFAAAAAIIMEGAVGFQYNAFKIPLAKKAIVRNCRMALNPKETQRPGAPPSL